MKLALFSLAALASMASADTAYLRSSSASSYIMNSLYDAESCLADCNEDSLGKKSKTKSTRKNLDRCYEGCFYHSDGSPTGYTRSVGESSADGIIDCTSKCAKDAEKNVKKAGKKDSKELKSCKASCDDDDKKCTKKCDSDEKKRISKEEDKAKKDALKKADKCTSRCVERGLFDEDVARVQADTE